MNVRVSYLIQICLQKAREDFNKMSISAALIYEISEHTSRIVIKR